MVTKYKSIFVDCLVLANDVAILSNDFEITRIQIDLLEKSQNKPATEILWENKRYHQQ